MHGGKVIVEINYDRITIKRKGIISFANHGLKGEKTIMLKQISAIQLKETGITNGYLQFILIGSQESKGGLNAALKDENSIVFGGSFNDKLLNKNAREIKNYIEHFNSSNSDNKIINNVIKNDDKYDKLKKVKELLDNDIISQEEFNREKEKILNS